MSGDNDGMDRREFLGKGNVRKLAGSYAKMAKDRFAATMDVMSGEPQKPVIDQVAQRQAMRQRPMVPLVRPPGAIEERAFLEGCTKCGDCKVACPHDAIREAPPGFREAAGTPIIIAIQNPCLMCPDTPCITACEPGVLRLQPPLKIATARIKERACIATAEEPCTLCEEHCPIADVISFRDEDGIPEVDAEACTGCGICQWACPAPHNAIVIEPLVNRPGLPPPAAD